MSVYTYIYCVHYVLIEIGNLSKVIVCVVNIQYVYRYRYRQDGVYAFGIIGSPTHILLFSILM